MMLLELGGLGLLFFAVISLLERREALNAKLMQSKPSPRFGEHKPE